MGLLENLNGLVTTGTILAQKSSPASNKMSSYWESGYANDVFVSALDYKTYNEFVLNNSPTVLSFYFLKCQIQYTTQTKKINLNTCCK